MLSHVAFVPTITIAAARTPPLPELAALQACVLCLSIAYHRNYERPGLLAKGEGTSAKLLFLYGTTQTFQSPDPTYLLANSACFCLTLAAFVGTDRRPNPVAAICARTCTSPPCRHNPRPRRLRAAALAAATNFDKRLYERWHPIGLHVVPGAWSACVASGHASLLPPEWVGSEPLLALPWTGMLT